jgi:aspartate beta-hydroxylase
VSFFYDRAADIVRHIYDSRLDGPPILDLASYFPAGKRFIDAWPALREEADVVASRLGRVPRFHEIMHEQTAISDNDHRDWRMLIVKAYGTEFPCNKALCPTLAKLIDGAPEVLSASISFLAPGKYIPPHRGPFRGVLRFYLGLSVPRHADGRPAAVLKVADTEHRIGSGDVLLWDDTFTHEAWSESQQVRSVLLLDVWRRDMPIDMELFSKLLIGLVRTGIRIRGAATEG